VEEHESGRKGEEERGALKRAVESAIDQIR